MSFDPFPCFILPLHETVRNGTRHQHGATPFITSQRQISLIPRFFEMTPTVQFGAESIRATTATTTAAKECAAFLHHWRVCVYIYSSDTTFCRSIGSPLLADSRPFGQPECRIDSDRIKGEKRPGTNKPKLFYPCLSQFRFLWSDSDSSF